MMATAPEYPGNVAADGEILSGPRIDAIGGMMNGRLSFSTDALPERERFPAFCEEIVRRYTGLDFTTRDQSGFHARVELQRLGAVDVGCVFSAPVNSARTATLVRDGDDSILVALLKRGEAYQTQCSGDQKLMPGDAIVNDCGYVGELNLVAESQLWQLKVPRRRMAALLPGFVGFSGARLDKDESAKRLLFGYLDGSFGVDFSGNERAAQLHEDHLIGLIALALGAQGDARRMAEENGVRTVRRAAILREIDVFFPDPGLSGTMVAARFGITPRYLHKLLAETGKSFSEHLMDARLQRAHALLCDPGNRHLRISSIAVGCGFSDMSHFNRVFRRRYAATPTDVREQGSREPGLRDQA